MATRPKPRKVKRAGAAASDTKKPKERSALDTIRRIREGRLDPAALSPASRRACVSCLRAEGLSIAEIAKVLNCSERTIARDRRAIQEAEALEPDPGLAGVFAGRLAGEAELAKSRIRRALREAGASVADRVAGERACFEIEARQIGGLQALGILPPPTKRLEAEVRAGNPQTIEDIQAEVDRLSKIERPKKRGKSP